MTTEVVLGTCRGWWKNSKIPERK